MKLYIIGNGFDIAHGLHTLYTDYYNYIKKHSNNINHWDIILDYYPEKHLFWSDAEKNICLINRTPFLVTKKAFGFTFLDDLLKDIRDSFERFIASIESSIDKVAGVFKLDKNALFINFNYTSVLEEVYHIEQKRVIHLHNTAGDAALKQYFKIDSSEIILGHSPHPEDFPFWYDKLIGSDKDYIEYRNKTTKNTKDIIKKYNLYYELLSRQTIIDEVVFYGFSFSLTDKDYIQLIFNCLPLSKTRFKIYYFVHNGESDEEAREKMLDNLIKCACDIKRCDLIKCNEIVDI